MIYLNHLFSLQKCLYFNLILDSWPIGTRKENVIVSDAIVGVEEKDFEQAIRVLYHSFVKEEPHV